MKKAHIHSLAEDMSLYRFHYDCARLEGVSSRLDIELLIQGNKLKRVMMPRARGRRSRAPINRAARAELIGAIVQLSSLRDTFWKSGRGARNIPDQPMQLIVHGVVAADLQIMHMQ